MSDQKICPTCGTEYPLSERFCPRDGTALRSVNVQADLLGSIVADRYHILKKLGEGGMGTVYLAEHVKMGRKSALKVMNPGMNTDPDAIARFNREAANASRLNHPNICGIYDFGETPEGMIYLAMEFVEGSSLTALIEKAGALPAPRCGSIIHQTADALQVAHDAGIVHRDLKPDNIMVAKSRDGSDLVKVVDFGIAKASSSDAQKVTKTGLVVGTPEYMSPEQLAGDKLDGRSDIYSLGLVAFNCLTGKLPFPAETVQEAMIMRLTDRPRTLLESRPEIAWTEELQRTLDKALERDAAERYQSAARFGREFAAAISAMPATKAVEAGTLVMGAAGSAPPAQVAPAPVPPTRVARGSAKTEQMEARPAPAAAPARRSPMAPILGGVGGVAVLGAALWFGFLKPKNTTEGTEGAGTSPPTVVDSTKLGGGAPAAGDTLGASGASGTQGQATNITTLTAPQKSPPAVRPGANPPAATPPATTVNVAQVLSSWRTKLENADEATQVRVGSDALREIEPMLDRLTGAELDQARFVALLGYGAINDITKTCRFARFVRDSRLGATEKSIATGLSQDVECPTP